MEDDRICIHGFSMTNVLASDEHWKMCGGPSQTCEERCPRCKGHGDARFYERPSPSECDDCGGTGLRFYEDSSD